MKYNIDFCQIENNILKIQGWAISERGKQVSINVNRDFSIKRIERLDVIAVLQDINIEPICGFEIYIKKTVFHSFNSIVVEFIDGIESKKVSIKQFLKEVKSKTIKKETCMDLLLTPLISVVIPVYNTNMRFFEELIKSLNCQLYDNWELCLADGGSEDGFKQFLKTIASDKIKIVFLDKNLGIAGNTNEAIRISSGEYIAFCDHDDVLENNALLEVAKEINKNTSLDFIYTDEDKLSMDSSKKFQPNRKSDFNIHLLEVGNYINHLSVIKKSFLDNIGWLNNEYEGSQDYDLVLRVAENTTNIAHIKKILYHWRCHIDSVAQNPKAKEYAFNNAIKALMAHFKRINEDVTITKSETYGSYKVVRNQSNEK